MNDFVNPAKCRRCGIEAKSILPKDWSSGNPFTCDRCLRGTPVGNAYGINFDAPHPLFPKVPLLDLKNYLTAYAIHKEESIMADLERNPFCMSCGAGVAFPALARVEDRKTGEHKGFLCLSCFGPKYDQSGFPLRHHVRRGDGG